MSLLSEGEIERELGKLGLWQLDDAAIVRELDCGDFVGSVELVGALVAPAEALNHHPDLSISWSTVTIRISTHSAGGLTALDFELARRIDLIAAKLSR